MKFFSAFFGVLIVLVAIGCVRAAAEGQKSTKKYAVTHSEAEWRKLLSPEAYDVLRDSGTERAFTGKLLDVHGKGDFVCAGCGQKLFTTDAKFDSGTGWPSFWKPISSKVVDEVDDFSDGMKRTEVKCSRCGGHLGHVFDDGPEPTGLRYCMNSVAMKFVPAKPK